jgi:outer membrane protein assembly factor BamB
VDEKVIVCPTGANGISLAAYHRESGQRLWQGGKDQASYSSPLLIEIIGVRQVLLHTSQGVTGHHIDDGKVLWSFPWTNVEQVNVSQPVPIPGSDGEFLVCTGYGRGSARFRVTRVGDDSWTAAPVWENRKPVMQAKFTTPVFYNGFVYGLDNGILACLEPATGKRRWIDGRYEHGQILLAGNKLIVQMERGKLALVSPSPDGLVELARIHSMDGKTWNNPVLAGRYLLVRNDREAVCYELSPE